MSKSKIEEELSSLIGHEQLLLGLDRDGTLMPIMHNPLESKIDSELAEIINTLTQRDRITTAVISARSIKMLQEDFDRDKIILAGVYGLEISMPGKPLLVQDFAQNLAEPVEKLYSDLLSNIGTDHEIVFETDPYSLCAWFPTESKVSQKELVEVLTKLLKQIPQLELHQFPDGLEVLPITKWSKADAMEVIAASINKAKYFYAGDASSDEPVFHWVNERGGVSVRVGNDGIDTQAKYNLPDVAAMRELLRFVCSII